LCLLLNWPLQSAALIRSPLQLIAHGAEGQLELSKGNRVGFVKAMSRVFFDDGNGDFEKRRGLANDVLGLPREDLDEATRRVVERSALAH